MRGTFCAVTAAAILLSLMSGCCGSQSGSRREPIRVETTARGCLETPPPAISVPERVLDGCPEGLVCLAPVGYLGLAEALERLADYGLDAWAACSDPAEETTK